MFPSEVTRGDWLLRLSHQIKMWENIQLLNKSQRDEPEENESEKTTAPTMHFSKKPPIREPEELVFRFSHFNKNSVSDEASWTFCSFDFTFPHQLQQLRLMGSVVLMPSIINNMVWCFHDEQHSELCVTHLSLSPPASWLTNKRLRWNEADEGWVTTKSPDVSSDLTPWHEEPVRTCPPPPRLETQSLKHPGLESSGDSAPSLNTEQHLQGK